MSLDDNAVGPSLTSGSDKSFHQFPRPTLAVDVALLTIDPDRRQLLVVEMAREDTGKWALPGTFLRERETLAEAVRRCLHDKLGVQGVRPRQLEVFDEPFRDHRDWVISVAHVAVVRPEQLDELGQGSAGKTRLAPVDRPGELSWDHPTMVRLAKEYVRSRYRVAADPERLLGPRFTLSELQRVHQAVQGREEIDRFVFRRVMKDHVVPTGVMTDSTGGRPAELFRRRSDRD